MNITLYHYWRSSASWRVRWALEIKKLKYISVPINIVDGESEREPHLSRNPLGFVPVLEFNGKYLIESVAILEWLEEQIPSPALYPKDGIQRAHIRALVEVINAGIQPIQNLTTLDRYSEDPQKRKEWMQFFIRRGFQAYEKLISDSSEEFSFESHVTAADIFLIPQVYNAYRNELDMSEFPKIDRIYKRALETPECQAAHPDKFQPHP